VILEDPVEKVPYVGRVYARKLGNRLGIKTVRDLLYHFPFRYVDYSKTSKIRDLYPGREVSVEGEIVETDLIRTRSRMFLTRAAVADTTGAIEVVWFNQPYLVRSLKKGGKIRLAGKVDNFGGKTSLVNPEYELLKPEAQPIHTSGLVAIYPETASVSSKWLRNRIKTLLKSKPEGFAEFIPEEILEKSEINKPEGFIERWEALKMIHFPETLAQARQARARFAFEELFLFNLRSLEQRELWKKHPLAKEFKIVEMQNKIMRFIAGLPFELTSAQRKAIDEILADLAKAQPMNRLLEGDVGSGKTVVAAVAAYLAYLCGARTILMAPTEVLADQHFATLKTFLEPYGVKIALHTGSHKPDHQTTRPPNDQYDLWIGTHALFYREKGFEKVGLIVIDEQHRFGVEQRAKLLEKSRSKETPHLLTLTATPIPRTLSLTVYGDLDLSVLDEMPPGRKRVKTFVVPSSKREAGYQWIQEKVMGGDQAFIICPLIEESEKETMQQVKAVTAEYEKVQKLMPNVSVGILHGKMSSTEKNDQMTKFKNGEIGILVSTPVVEVGIDVPNATIMVIEAAERFGLASLHQLRGRVGRGEKDSYCFLFVSSDECSDYRSRPEEEIPPVIRRLKALEGTSSGFELAELDLKLRGPGELYGTMQHGLAELKIADLTDSAMLKISRDAAQETMRSDLNLEKHTLLAKELKRFSSALVEPN